MMRRRETKVFYEILVINNSACYASPMGAEFEREEDAKEYCSYKNNTCDDCCIEYVYIDFEREV